MATIALYKDKINNISSAFGNLSATSNNLNSQLGYLKTTLQGVSCSEYDLQTAVNSISSSTKSEKAKVQELKNLGGEIDSFITTAVSCDQKARDEINEAKEDFYTEYSYLKPREEMDIWERIADDWNTVCEYCAENWESLVSIIVAVIAVVVIVAACVVTFGAMTVLVAGIVGAIVGLGCQLVSDLISFSITGEWGGTWQNYLGAAIGGAVGGILTLTGCTHIACMAEAGFSSFISGHLTNLTSIDKKSFGEIAFDTVFNMGVSLALGKLLEKPTNFVKFKLSHKFSNITFFRRMTGSGNYDAAYRMVLTKLKNGINNSFSWRTIRNGVVFGMTDSYLSSIANGFLDGFKVSDAIKGFYVYYFKSNIFVGIDYSKFAAFQN